jgi:anti-sigma factor RsiW
VSEREPTRDELLAMAWVDGELAGEERESFERRLAEEEALRREVGELQRLALLARASRPCEPMDFEWARLRRDPLQRTAVVLGFALLALGVLGLSVLALVALETAHVPLLVKALGLALAFGLALLGLAALRARLATRRYDPYREVER